MLIHVVSWLNQIYSSYSRYIYKLKLLKWKNALRAHLLPIEFSKYI
jgi:hypothetical protein